MSYTLEDVEKLEEAEDVVSEDMEDMSDPSKYESMTVESDLDNIDKLIQATQEPLEESRHTEGPPKPTPLVVHRQEMVDDMIRNFFINHGMQKSLGAFQKEWYEISQKGKVKSDETNKVPDIKIKNQQLRLKMDQLNNELETAKISAESAKATWDKLKKEKEYHMMHHKRVQEEKERLFKDIEKLKALHFEYETKFDQLKNKYEAAMKEKMLIKMERDRFWKTSHEMNTTLKRLEKQDLSEDEETAAEKKAQESRKRMTLSTKTANGMTRVPKQDASNPFLTQTFEAQPNKGLNPTRNFKAHNLAVTALAIHPRKPFIATGGDDFAWKIWSVPGGEMIIQGESHKDWVSGLDFNPIGTSLATCSGDSTVKIWDFVKVQCSATFKCHTQPVYSLSFHHTGDFLVSGRLC